MFVWTLRVRQSFLNATHLTHLAFIFSFCVECKEALRRADDDDVVVDVGWSRIMLVFIARALTCSLESSQVVSWPTSRFLSTLVAVGEDLPRTYRFWCLLLLLTRLELGSDFFLWFRDLLFFNPHLLLLFGLSWNLFRACDTITSLGLKSFYAFFEHLLNCLPFINQWVHIFVMCFWHGFEWFQWGTVTKWVHVRFKGERGVTYFAWKRFERYGGISSLATKPSQLDPV